MATTIVGKKLKFSQSIAIQVLIPMAVIGLLALGSMLVSLLVTLNTQHDAEAINIAGSMRMQSYRMALLLQQSGSGEAERINLSRVLGGEYGQFSRKLYQSSISRLAGDSDDADLSKAYERVVDSWESNIVPLLALVISSQQVSDEDIATIRDSFLAVVDRHVADIDSLVLSIQKNTEEKIELLGMYEGLSIFLSFLALVFIVMRTDQNLVRPLKDLVRAAEYTSLGDFSYRTYYEAVNEIGMLCSTFNNMSASLARHYRKLEDLVDEKTVQLQQTNQRMDFLYSTAKRLSEAPTDRQVLTDIVTDLKKITAVPQLSLCLASEVNSDKFDLIGPVDDQRDSAVVDSPNCSVMSDIKHRKRGDLLFPIEDGSDSFGFLYVQTGHRLGLESWQQRLIEAAVEHLSSAMALHYREGLSRRLMLFEERSIIARELHDSLAQSLSYMKIQVARISTLFDRNASEDMIREGVDDLQQGLNAAYKHLRELLTTFRLKLDTPTLYHALQNTVDEFSRQNEAIDVVLNYELGHCPLSPNEDIHVLQIIREAMTNVIKHARASRIELNCERGDHNEAVFKVVDNGIGISDNPHKEHHYGLSTMVERAALVNGKVNIGPGANGGTAVVLTFVPETFRLEVGS